MAGAPRTRLTQSPVSDLRPQSELESWMDIILDTFVCPISLVLLYFI